MKLVAADQRSGGSDRAWSQQTGLSVTEVQAAFAEAGRMAEQAGHGMSDAISILEGFAEHHVAATLAVNRAGRGEFYQSIAKPPRGCERAGVELRVTAGQPANITPFRRRLIGQ